MSSSRSKDKDPSDIHSGLKSLDYINPKLGSIYFRLKPGEGLRYTSTDAFLAWKVLPSTKNSTASRPFYIFLHDYGSSSHMFHYLASRIPNFCLAVDFKGWGRSDDTKDENNRAYSMTHMKNQIPPIVNLLQGEQFLLVGHGMGGKVAQLYASQQPPNNLIGLVLLASAPLSPWRPSTQIMDKYKAAYTKKGASRKLESFIKTTLAGCPIDDTDLGNLVEDGNKDTPLAKEAWLTYGMQENHSHGVGRIKVPVLLRAGAEDKVISLEDMEREISTKVDLCVQVEVHGCGHLLPLEDEELPDVLEKFGMDAEKLKAGKRVLWIDVNEKDLQN